MTQASSGPSGPPPASSKKVKSKSKLLPIDHALRSSVKGGSFPAASRLSHGAIPATSNCDVPPLDRAVKMLTPGSCHSATVFPLQRRFNKLQSDTPGPAQPSYSVQPLDTDGLRCPGPRFGPPGGGGSSSGAVSAGAQLPRTELPGPGSYSFERLFDHPKTDADKVPLETVLRRVMSAKPSMLTYSSEETANLLEFAFGCSLDEHIRFGHCLDGRCGRRSKFEHVSAGGWRCLQLAWL